MNNYSEISKELPGNLDEKSRNLLLKFIMLSKTLSKQQIEEIRMGLEENVDVSLYAKKDFSVVSDNSCLCVGQRLIHLSSNICNSARLPQTAHFLCITHIYV